MDSTTPNGFPVIEPDDVARLTTVVTVGGAKFRVAKSAANLWTRWLRLLNAVELFSEAGWDGGYAHRPVTEGTAPSEHAAGMAVDVNASQHERDRDGVRTDGWSATQVRVIRWALAHTAMGKAIKWGADFQKTPDPMHFEVRSPAHLKAYNKAHP